MAQQQDFTAFDDDLALFTNTDFLDFDLPDDLAFAAPALDAPHVDFQPQPAYYDSLPVFPVSAANSLPPSPPNGLPLAAAPQQSQPTVPTAAQFASILTPAAPQPPAQKRKSSGTAQLEDTPQVAAEEDKRRRNTAASARFRVKKKQREQALEQTAKEMSDRVHVLEARVGQLEMENKWLKSLVTEKNLSLDGAPESLIRPEADEMREVKRVKLAAKPE